MNKSTTASYGRGNKGSVIDLSDPSFNGWPSTLEGEIYLAGSPESGLHTRPNRPIHELAAEEEVKRGNSRFGKIEARIAALEAILVS